MSQRLRRGPRLAASAKRAISRADLPVIIEEEADAGERLRDAALGRVVLVERHAEEAGLVVVEYAPPLQRQAQRRRAGFEPRGAQEQHRDMAAGNGLEGILRRARQSGRLEPRGVIAREEEIRGHRRRLAAGAGAASDYQSISR